jgi:hypothetical protein
MVKDDRFLIIEKENMISIKTKKNLLACFYQGQNVIFIMKKI